MTIDDLKALEQAATPGTGLNAGLCDPMSPSEFATGMRRILGWVKGDHFVHDGEIKILKYGYCLATENQRKVASDELRRDLAETNGLVDM